MSFLGIPADRPPPEPITGTAYLCKLHKYLQANAVRLAPSPSGSSSKGFAPSLLQQSYTLLTLGLDPNSAPLSRNVKIPLTLGFGTPSVPKPVVVKPLLLRLPPDRLLYLMLRWQSLPQNLPHVGRTDLPIENGVPVAARGARLDDRKSNSVEGDVKSVSSWVGSMRSVSLGSLAGKDVGRGWFGKKEEINEDQILLALYSMFTLLPALLIHPPFVSQPPILDLIEAGGYTQLGGIDVRVPLDVLRNLQILELESYDPRALLVPPNPGLRSLTVRDVQDGDDWIEELLTVTNTNDKVAPISSDDEAETTRDIRPRFPNLRHLSLIQTTLLSFPSLPLTSLTHLDLSHNLIDNLPSSLSSLSSLISLNLSNNGITSVRSAPSILGNITSLNLSKNRIDCLVGLERVLGLERVDIRSNELMEEGEVGRLAVLPHIKEIWCTNNPFDYPNSKTSSEAGGGKEEWRIEIGATYKSEGKDILLDDIPFTWNESRRIEGLLSSRGKTPKTPDHYNRSTPTVGRGTVREQPSQDFDKGSIASRQPTRTSASAGTASPASNNSAAISKKKGRRRVIRLDSEGPPSTSTSTSAERGIDEGGRRKSGSISRPGIVEEDELESRLDKALSLRGTININNGNPNGADVVNETTTEASNGNGNGQAAEESQVKSSKVSTKKRTVRKGLAKDTFVPTTTTTTAGERDD